EPTLTQNALAGAAGIRTRLLRPPYSSEPKARTAADWSAYRRAARYGYLIVLATVDTKDWARPGVKKIVSNAVGGSIAAGRGGHGAIIMLHDSGGNRSQTVRALPRIIVKLRARGYRFVTVTGGRHPPAEQPARVERAVGGRD